MLITNNRCSAEAFAKCCDCLFNESWNYGQVLLKARDKVHQGYELLSHPQCGNMKPNQTPYKSLVLARSSLGEQNDFASITLIEQALEAHEKFQNMRRTPAWPDHILCDFRTIDVSLMQSVFSRL